MQLIFELIQILLKVLIFIILLLLFVFEATLRGVTNRFFHMIKSFSLLMNLIRNNRKVGSFLCFLLLNWFLFLLISLFIFDCVYKGISWLGLRLGPETGDKSWDVMHVSLWRLVFWGHFSKWTRFYRSGDWRLVLIPLLGSLII